ncbi:hypothetical protein SAMN05216215_101885 [Saccharopolyspora shandongensis]|uniref:Uncharacterized protein n=1 Tax=Saccharopolyspora shandongensis TaxID=418495 RepID=A0A1H3G8D6_9PSEU|nr:hypothetical protein [Saccharopolyspora shandongensis]SDX99521.1 hypothetical protein SAMN05216215_101885 [Saccharopolyspora shandongensis]
MLNAAPFRLRLFLSALSGPHLFLAGGLTAYRRHTDAADRATAQLALALLDETETVTVTAAAAHLLSGPGGERGKDWLGWEPSELDGGVGGCAVELITFYPFETQGFWRHPGPAGRPARGWRVEDVVGVALMALSE